MADPTAPRPRRRVLRLAIFAGSAIALLYAVACGALYFKQDAILFPGHRTQGTVDATKYFADRVERVTLDAGGTPVVARFRPAESADAVAPTVLFFYGNAMCAAWCDGIVEMLNGLGCNVLVADYIGYGESGGKPSEAGLYATADAAWKHLQGRSDIDRDRVIVMGWSLGAAVAVDLASRVPAAGLITLSAFTSVPDVAADAYPLVPTAWIVRSRFENLAKVPAVRCPTLLVHGRADTLIEPGNADRLAAAFGTRAELLWLENADHNTMFEADPPALAAAIRGLLEGSMTSARPADQ